MIILTLDHMANLLSVQSSGKFTAGNLSLRFLDIVPFAQSKNLFEGIKIFVRDFILPCLSRAPYFKLPKQHLLYVCSEYRI